MIFLMGLLPMHEWTAFDRPMNGALECCSGGRHLAGVALRWANENNCLPWPTSGVPLRCQLIGFEEGFTLRLRVVHY